MTELEVLLDILELLKDIHKMGITLVVATCIAVVFLCWKR